MNRVHGKKGQVRLDKTGGSTFAAVASLNKFNIDMSTDTVDVTAFQDTNKIYVVGLPDIKGNLGGFWDSDDVVIFDVAMGGLKAALELTPDSLNPTFLWKGLAFLNMSIDVAADGAVTSSGSYVAAGPWGRYPSTAITATSATAGVPGIWNPAGSAGRANLAGMTGCTASPSAAWVTGQYMLMQDGNKCYWNGTTWVAGTAP